VTSKLRIDLIGILAVSLPLIHGCDYFPDNLLLRQDLTHDVGQEAGLDARSDGPDARLDGPDARLDGPDARLDGPQPDHPLVDLALVDAAHDHALESAPDTGGKDTTPPDSTQPDQAPVDFGIVVPGTWALIPAGSFSMGSPGGELCRNSANETQHTVTLTRAFWISTTEVTQAQFTAVLGYNPASKTSCLATCAVESVSWHQAAAYCNALSDQAKLAACYSCSGSGASVSCASASAYGQGKIYDCPGFRLPTDAEWEYAYRAKTTTALYNGAVTNCKTDVNGTKIAWYTDNAGGTPHGVAGLTPNAWGLHDMAGNVFEWCHDWYVTNLGSGADTDPWGGLSGSFHVLRGGAWGYPSEALRAAYRSPNATGVKAQFTGLRCVRTKK